MDPAVQARLLEINRRFYATIAEPFDATRRSTPPGLSALVPRLALRPGALVADVGCGNGRLTWLLDATGVPVTYVGVDGDAALLALAAAHTAGLAQVTCRFAQADLARPDWVAASAVPPHSCDAVVCLATLQHLPGRELRARVMSELASLVAPQGVVAVSAWQFLSADRFVAKQIAWQTVGLTPAEVEPGDALLPWQQGGYAVRYVHQLDLAELTDLAARVGLAVAATYYADGKEGNLNLYAILRPPAGRSFMGTDAMQNNDSRTQSIVDDFQKRFNTAPTLVAIGPGRVNLIGEHTDYNDGFVLPVAIRRDIRIVLRPRADRIVRTYSLEYDDWYEFSLDDLRYNQDKLWANYVMGVAWALQELGVTLTGFDGIISGNVPRASGLSSSAALEVATATALLAAAGQRAALDGVQIARAAQRAENKFVGVNCGIMDQFISVLGQEGHALLIDCRSLDYQLIPFPREAALVIGNTKASRSLAGSAYNERRRQCETGVAALQAVLPGITALRDVTPAQLEEHKALLPPVVYRRCRHVVSEDARVLQTIAALEQGDLATVGRLMNDSHTSLRDDYEVSSAALDAMVDAMRSVPGCYGARLTGAGFGGCAVALVKPGVEQTVADAIYEKYPKTANIWPEVYISAPGPGAQLIEL